MGIKMKEYNRLIDTIITTLQPGMQEYADDSQFLHWMDYACQLDEIEMVNYKGEDLVAYLNGVMLKYSSNNPEHEAACDVASTIESLIPEYKSKFKY